MTTAPPRPKADGSASDETQRNPSAWRRLWTRIRGGRLTRQRLAASVAIGLFVGCLPLYGLHFPLCILLCLPLRLDILTAYLAANISNPLVAPVLVSAEIQTGFLLLNGRLLEQVPQSWSEASHLAGPLALGSVVVGSVLAAVGAALAYRVGPEPGPLERARAAAIDRTAQRYRRAERQHRYYVSVKLRTDPLVELCADLGDMGSVLDVGCGRGQLSLFLLELGATCRVSGFDWDADKLTAAEQAAAGQAEFTQADVTDANAPWRAADTVLLIDVLHYLSADGQAAVLERAARHVRPGGRLLVRDTDAGRWQSRLALFAERVAVRIGMNRGRKLTLSRTTDITSRLELAGLRCQSASAGSGLGNVLVIATRQAADSGSAGSADSERS